MKQSITVINQDDPEGRPAGGHIHGIGLEIRWQNGPLGRGENRTEPNGCFVETVLAAAQTRLEYYQASDFACDDNEEALGHVQLAIAALERRTAGREERGVEGTHEQ